MVAHSTIGTNHARLHKMRLRLFTLVAENATLPPMSTNTAFSEFRKNSDLTLDAVADLFKVDRTTILRWEKGVPPVPVKRLREVEALTGISRERLRPDVFASQPEKAVAS